MHVLLHSVPPTLQQATANPRLSRDSRIPTGKSGEVSGGVLSSGSWCTRFCCALQVSVSQPCVSSGSSVMGLMATSSKRAYAVSDTAAPRASVPEADPRWAVPPQETLKHSSVSVSVGSPGPGAHKVCLSLLSISGRNGAYAKCELAPPTILLGLLLYPWMWGISSQPLQYLWSYWDFSDLRLEVSPYGQSSEVQPLFLTLEVGYLFLAAHCSSMSQPPLALTYLFAFNLSTDSFNVNQ